MKLTHYCVLYLVLWYILHFEQFTCFYLQFTTVQSTEWVTREILRIVQSAKYTTKLSLKHLVGQFSLQ